MKKFSKILVLLLTFSLLLGALAVFASADVSETDVAKIGDTGYETFELAMEAALASEEPVTITLLSDVTLTQGFTLTKSVTVDLNWHKIIDPASVTALVFHANTDDITVVFKNGIIEYAGNNLFQVTGNNATLALSNLYVKHTVAASQYAFSFTNTTGNVPNLVMDNCVVEAGRVFMLDGNYLNVDATDCVLRSSNNSNVIRISAQKFLDGELNFTNCHMWTGTGNNARLIEMGNRMENFGQMPAAGTHGMKDSAEGLNYEYELVDGTTYKITKIDNAVFNFYNCSFYSEGNVTIGPGIYEMHFYGGYYGNLSSSALLSNTSGIARQLLGRVYFHTYEDEEGNVYYPTFNQDPSESTHIVMSDLYDFDVTFTYDGTNYGNFTIANKTAKENAAAIVANQKEGAAYGYVFVPAGDASTPSVVDPTAVSNAVAMLNGKLYSDFGLAAAAAGEGDVITLLAEVSGGTEVTALVTVNTNGFAFAPNIDTEALMTETVQGNLVAIVEVSADAEFVDHYYWKDAESCAAANDDENGFDWESFDWEAGVAPEGLLAYKALPVGSSADFTSVGFAGVDLSYVDEESNYYSHIGWEVIGGSEEEFYFDYTPKTESVGKATFLIIDDATGAIISSGYTDDDGLDEENGDKTNYSAAFTNAMYTASANTTIKLVSDIVIYSDNNQMGTSAFTLDLNGHTLSLAEGKCIGKGIATSSTCKANAGVIGHACTFRCAGQLKLTIKSSLPGGLVYNTAKGGNQFIWLNGDCTGGYINIIGENLTIHSSTLVASSVKSTTNAAPFEINIDGGTYLTTDGCTSNGFIQATSVNGATTYNIKNAFIDSRGYHLTYVGQSKSVNFNQIINFENCVILLKDSCKVLQSKASQYYDHTFLSFKDCAVLGSPINDYSYTDGDGLFSTPTVNISGNCYFTHPVAAGGVVFANALVDVADYNVSVFSTYRFAKRTGAAYSPETHTAEFLLSKTDLVEYTVAYATTDKALSEQCATVNYTVGGEAYKTVNVLVSKDGVTNGATAANVSFSETENYVKSTYTGKVVVDKIDTYSVALDATKVVSVSGVKYNLTLASEIAINVAVPADVLNYLSVVVDGKTFTKENATLITIGEEEYYVISYAGITATDTVGTVEFAIVGGEGVTPANVVTSVAAYANKLMTKGANDVEKELGRALLVYTLEAYKALDAENIAAIEALTAYAAAVPEDENFMAEDTAALAAYFEGAFLRLESTPGIVFVAKEAAIGKTFTFTYVDENLKLVSEEVTFTAEKLEYELEMKVYNLDQNITLTVDASDTALSYNLDTYLASLAETNNAFAQAIYRYVNAAKAYVTAE